MCTNQSQKVARTPSPRLKTSIRQLQTGSVRHPGWELVARRAKREPIAYLTGVREFWSLDLRVTPDTLIPRPDSEALVEAALEITGTDKPRILDLGTGSGCLLLAILTERRHANGLGIDITGDTNTVSVSQGDYATDSGDHRIMVDIDGSTNTLNLSQRNDGNANSEHYMSLDLDSSQNVISMQQLNDGDKFLFLDVDNNNNTVDINQSGSGSHYLDLHLESGSYAHDVDISQTGTGNHGARIDLDGYSTDFDLQQQGSTDQNYSVDMTCGTANGCAVSTTQGN